MATYNDESSTLFDIPRPAPAPTNPTPAIYDKPYKHSVVDSKKTPIETIAAYIGGSNWLVDYYSQQIDRSEELKSFDPSQLGAYQSYVKINRLFLKLQGALNSDDDRDTGRFNMTGTAIVTPLPNLIPNVGDAFIADIGEGGAGQFTVTDVRQFTNNLSTAYEINFKLDRNVDELLVNQLNSKVVKELHYVQDYLISGQDALLTTNEYNEMNWLNEQLNVISKRYMESFYNHDAQTLIVPNQTIKIYDPYVTRIITQIIGYEDSRRREIKLYNCDDWRIPTLNDVYWMAYSRDPSMIFSCFTGYGVIDKTAISATVYQNTIRYSQLDSLVVPIPKQDYVNNYTDLINLANNSLFNGFTSSSTCVKNPLDSIIEKTATPCCEPSIVGDSPTLSGESNDYIVGMDIPTVGGSTYVLGQGFFDHDLTQCTAFERAVWNIIDRKPLNNSDVLSFCKYFHYWSPLQQFYLGPLLIIMVRTAIRGI